MSIEFYKPFNGISSNVRVCDLQHVTMLITDSKKHKDSDMSQQSKPAPVLLGEVFLMHSISLSVSVLSHPCVKLPIVDVCIFVVRHFEIMPILYSECLSLSSCPVRLS